MKAVRLHGIGDLRVEEVPEPEPPAADEVLVAVEAAGICGSDIHNFRTGMWLTRRPSIPGHELCGTVLACGSGVDRLRTGDRVIADSRVFCGSCDRCVAGLPNLCRSIGYVGEVVDGGFAPLVKLRQHQFLRLEDQALDPCVAAMAEPLAVALHAVNRLQPARGEAVLVTGAGPIGALTAIVLASRGSGPVFVLDRNSDRLALVERAAGAIPLHADHLARHGGEWSCVVETTGSAAVLGAVIPRMSAGGRIVTVGIFHGAVAADLNRIVEGEVELRGCAAFRDELHEANRLLAGLAPRLALLADQPIGLGEVPAAYDRLAAGRMDAVKVIVRPD